MRTCGKIGPGAGLRGALAMLAVVFSAVSSHGGGKCGGDSASYRIMPPVIGRPGAMARSPYDLPCDSMVVPHGQTTIIHGLSVVNFGPGSRAGGKIVVKGKLVIEGKPGQPAYLAGSIASNVIGFAPGHRPWFGIQADSGAVLRISHARFYNASAGMILKSRDVILKNCYFKGSSALTLPENTLPLNPVGQSLASLDLREGWMSLFSGGSSAKPADGPADEPEDRMAEESAEAPEAGPESGSASSSAPAPTSGSAHLPASPSAPITGSPSESRPAPRTDRPARKRYPDEVSRAGKAWTWLAGGAGVLALSAAVWWALPADEKPPAPSPPSGPLDAAPALPDPGNAGP